MPILSSSRKQQATGNMSRKLNESEVKNWKEMRAARKKAQSAKLQDAKEATKPRGKRVVKPAAKVDLENDESDIDAGEEDALAMGNSKKVPTKSKKKVATKPKSKADIEDDESCGEENIASELYEENPEDFTEDLANYDAPHSHDEDQILQRLKNEQEVDLNFK